MSSNTDTVNGDAQNQTDNDVGTVYEKDVLITAYADPDAEYEDKRDFMASVFGEFLDEDTDLYDTYTTEVETVELVISASYEDEFGETRTFEEKINPFGSNKRKLKKLVLDGVINPAKVPWLEANIESTVETDFSNSTKRPLADMVGTLGNRMKAPGAHGFSYKGAGMFNATWKKEVESVGADAEEGETDLYRVTVNACHTSDIKKRRVLAHQSERSPSNRYETPEDVPEEDLPWSVQVSIRIETGSENSMIDISEELVGEYYGEIALLDGIQKVRLTDCETTKKSRGQCYDI